MALTTFIMILWSLCKFRPGAVLTTFILLTALPGFSSAGVATVVSLNGQKAFNLRDLAGSIEKCLSSRGDLKLAVTGIRTLDGSSNGLTAWLAEKLTVRLSLLERGRLNEIAAENELGFSDLFDQGQMKALGKFLSADDRLPVFPCRPDRLFLDAHQLANLFGE